MGILFVAAGLGAMLAGAISIAYLYRSASIQAHQSIPLLQKWESWIAIDLAEQPESNKHESLRESLIRRLSDAERHNVEVFEQRMHSLKKAYQHLAYCIILTLVQGTLALLPTIIGTEHYGKFPTASSSTTTSPAATSPAATSPTEP